MTQTLQEWAERAATLPAVLVEATPRAVRAGADVLEGTARANLTRASGGDLRLSRVRSGKGARVDVRVRTDGSGSRARAIVVPVGPVSLVENDTRQHQEPFQYLAQRTGGARSYSMARRRKASRRGFLYMPGIGYRMRARHPGTKGKEPVAKAMLDAGVAGRAGAAVFTRAVAEHLS